MDGNRHEGPRRCLYRPQEGHDRDFLAGVSRHLSWPFCLLPTTPELPANDKTAGHRGFNNCELLKFECFDFADEAVGIVG